MATRTIRHASSKSNSSSFERGALGVTIAWILLSGCSLRDLKELGPGHRNTAGAAGAMVTASGGTEISSSGGVATNDGGAAGSTDGGAAGESGINAGGGGGVLTVAGQAGTTSGTAGAAAGNIGTAGSSAAGGSVSSCPPDTVSGGKLLTPPSSGFELAQDWTTTTSRSTAITRVQSAAACEGSWYIACNGTMRSAGWDGPAYELLPYVVTGHKYAVSLIARFDPNKSPTQPQSLTLVIAKNCVDSAVTGKFEPQAGGVTLNDWQRLTGTFVVENYTGCSQLGRLTLYIETDDTAKNFSVDVDDFKLWDVTDSTGS